MVAWEKEEHGEIDTRASLLPFRRSLLHKCSQAFVCTLFFAIFTFSHYCTQHNALTQVYECFEYFVPSSYVGKGAQLHVLRISFGVCHDILTSWSVTIDCWGMKGPARCDN